MPSAAFEGRYLHDGIFEPAAAYAFHICQNHPFLDGNKRTALAAAVVFLDLNGIELHDPEETLYSLMMNVAEGKKNKKDIARALSRLQLKPKAKKSSRSPGKE